MLLNMSIADGREKHSGSIAVVMLAALVLYSLSYGPVMSLWAYGLLPDQTVAAYAPLEWAIGWSSTVERAYFRYVDFCIENLQPDRRPLAKELAHVEFVLHRIGPLRDDLPGFPSS